MQNRGFKKKINTHRSCWQIYFVYMNSLRWQTIVRNLISDSTILLGYFQPANRRNLKLTIKLRWYRNVKDLNRIEQVQMHLSPQNLRTLIRCFDRAIRLRLIFIKQFFLIYYLKLTFKLSVFIFSLKMQFFTLTKHRLVTLYENL